MAQHSPDFSLAPRLRGEGRGEGSFRRLDVRMDPSPEAFGFD
ncbi:MAG: hypothetical protein ACI9HH_005778, partial [Pseudomonadota bacterium]